MRIFGVVSNTNNIKWLEKIKEFEAKCVPVYLNITDNLVKLNLEKGAVVYYKYCLELKPDNKVKKALMSF